MKSKLKGKLTYANVVSTLCLFVLLGGSAYAALKIPRNSVGTRQLQAKSVTNGKLANGAVNGAKIAEGSITGQNINLSALGTVPQAANAASAQNANTVDEHSASCPQGATLIRGLCFDAQPNPAVNSVKEAADQCAAKGGYLPSPLELYSVRGVLNLGQASALIINTPMSSTATPTAPTTAPWSSTGPGRSVSLKSTPPPSTPASIRWCGRFHKS